MVSPRMLLMLLLSLCAIKSTYGGCGANVTDGGNITSPDYPSPYPPNAYCKWTLFAAPGMALQVTCFDFNLESNLDYLDVTSYALNKSTLLSYRLTGRSTTCSLELGVNATVVFTSDSSIEYRGFVLIFRSVVPPVLSRNAFTGCGGDLKNEGYVISPNYPNNYPSNCRCVWKLRARDRALLHISSSSNGIDIEFGYDFLLIYNSKNMSQISNISDWRSFQQSATWIELASEVVIEFTSDESVEKRGFYLYFSSQTSSYAPISEENFTDCGSTLTGEGNITSPDYPAKYPNSTSCKWTLFARSEMILQLFCFLLDLEDNFDYVSVTSQVFNKSTILSYSLTGLSSACSLNLGSSAEIVFRSDSSIERHGFALGFISTVPPTFSTTEFTQCGGDLKNEGYVTSPNYPHDYPSNCRCVWKLRARDGALLQIRRYYIIDVEIGYDFLIIYNSRNTAQISNISDWQSFLQSVYWTELTSEVVIEFTSDESVQKRGFSFYFYSQDSSNAPIISGVNYTDCGSTLTGEGNITSPDYPAKYPNGTYCKWTLFARPGMILQLFCFSLDLEDNFDYVSATSQAFNKTTIISYSLTGYSSTCSLNLGPSAEIVFRSDSSIERQGFALGFISMVPPTFSRTAFTQCGGNLNIEAGVTSPNYGGNYPSNCRCIWKLKAGDGALLQLKFGYRIDIEIGYDSIRIYNSRNLSQVSNISDWESFQQSLYWIQLTSEVVIEFTSDESVEKTGFAFYFYSRASSNSPTSTEIFTDCGANLTGEGNLTSPNFPAEYPNNAFCKWNIFARPGLLLQLFCLSFDLENNFDNVQVTSKASYNTDIESYSLTGSPGSCSFNLSSSATIVFTSDSSIQRQGFVFTFQSVALTTATTDCGGTLYQTGELSSPNFPGDYPNDKACNWTLIASPGNIVSLTFQRFELESGADFLRVYNDAVVTWRTPFFSYTGFTIPQQLLLGTAVTVVFTSDDLITFPGFRATFTSVPTLNESNVNADSSTPTPSVCGGLLRSNGEITSPNFPYPYPNNAACVWTFSVKRGFAYNFKFLNFSTEELWDYVVVKREDVKMAKFFGSKLPQALSVDSNGSVSFTSDESIQMSGFRMRYSVVAAKTTGRPGVHPTTSSQGICGVAAANLRAQNNRIVGGYVAPAHSVPWQVLLTMGATYFGGALINNRWILTAASNIRNARASAYNALLGKQKLTAQDAGQVKVTALAFVKHPTYNETTGDGDIALIKLKTAIRYSGKVRPICLPIDAAQAGDMCYATGWGYTKEGIGGGNLLKVARVPIIGREMCLKYLSPFSKNQLCGGYVGGGEDVCQGDTGGPLVYYNNGRYELQGIISARSECGKPFSPSIFTAVAPYTAWIRNVTSTN